MSKPIIVITGANGFIGEYLVKHFNNKGWTVRALVHHAPKTHLDDVQYFRYCIEEKVVETIFERADYLVHCAYLRFEKDKNSNLLNINATKDLIAICRKNNIKSVFLSSFSAHPNAQSNYGKTKLECEKLFDISKDVILKPGLVIGKKGLSGELINRIRHSLFFPLVAGGKQPVQTIYIEDLCLIIEKVLIDDQIGIFHVAEETTISMKKLYQELAIQQHKKIVFIPIPVSLLFLVCRCCEFIGIKLPVSSESVLGLKQLIIFDTKEDLKKLDVSLKNYRQSIQAVLK